MSEKIFFCPQIYTENEFKQNKFMIVNSQGVIIDIVSDIDGREYQKLEGIVLPGLVNSHSHAFQILLRGRNEHPKNFKDWVETTLYPLIENLNPEDISVATQSAFSQMIRNGITTVAEFHYIHNNIDGSFYKPKDLISEKIIEAALLVGIRIRFLFSGYDKGKKSAQKRFHRSPDDVISSIESLRKKYQKNQTVHVGVAPHSLHGASIDMIRKLINWAKRNREIAHIHVAEQETDIQLATNLYGFSPIRTLAKFDLLNEYVSIIHGIWVDEDEIEILKDKGSHHVYNPTTNMYLGDGIAPISLYLKHKVLTAVGCDANITIDILREMRTVEWLQRIQSHEMGIISKTFRNGPQKAGSILFEMGTINGGSALNLPIGSLQSGQYADFVVIDPQDFSFRPLGNKIDNLVSSLEIQRTIKQVFVGANLIYDTSTGFQNFDEIDLIKKFQQIR